MLDVLYRSYTDTKHRAASLRQLSFRLLPVTAASDLLVHKILLNSVLLSPIVSGSVRPNPPRSQPPLFAAVRGSVGVRTPPRGSDKVRSTGYCQFSTVVLRCPTAAENGVMTKGVMSGKLTSVSGV